MFAQYGLDKIKFANNIPTFERAVDLYEQGKVTQFRSVADGFSAVVMGSQPYRVCVSARHYDQGSCECYLGRNDTLCKHLVAVAIYAVVGGRKLGEAEKRTYDRPVFSGRVGSLSKEELGEVKNTVKAALRYIKPYEGPSRVWFAYQDSLREGCHRLSAVLSHLLASEQTATLVINLLLQLDRKLSRGGVDDSDGTVGEFMEGAVVVLQDFVKANPRCGQVFNVLKGKSTCFGWEEPLLHLACIKTP